MARVRVQRQAWRPLPTSAANRPLSPAPRLADVVRSHGILPTSSLVHSLRGQAAPRRQGCTQLAQPKSLPRESSTVRARIALPVQVLLSGRQKADGALVATRDDGDLFPGGLAAKPSAADGAAAHAMDGTGAGVKVITEYLIDTR